MPVEVKMQGFADLFRAIGSTEVASHVAVAYSNAATFGRDTMRSAMPNVLGHDVKGPKGMVGRFGEPTQRTINAIEYVPLDFRKVKSLDEVRTTVFVQNQSGNVTKDQIAYLKYLFGDGPNFRLPGDVGMDNDAVRVPQNEAILLTKKYKVDPYYAGGRQALGILSGIKKRAAADAGSFFETPAEKLSTAMSQLALTNRSRGLLGRDSQRVFDDKLKRMHHGHGMPYVEMKMGLGMGGTFDKETVSKAAGSYAKSKQRRNRWSVYEGKDKSGLPTYFARPLRVVDPRGGTHQIARKNGKNGGPMPNMISVAPEYGEAGASVGPRLLFRSLHSARYEPKLHAPWDASIAAAAAYLEEAIFAELDHALGRKAQGRSY